MAQIFPPSANTLSRASLLAAGAFVLLGGWAWGVLLRSPWATQVDVAREQPVAFSHAHHVGALGLDCRYCHASVERSAFAGLPSSKVCMTCHSQVWPDSEALAPVREAYREDRPLAWTRVHDLPDFTYFNHAVHVERGVSCTSCHGPVERMPLAWRTETLHMEWCLDCHRDPEPRLSPAARRRDPAAVPDGEGPAPHPVDPGLDCSTCHR